MDTTQFYDKILRELADRLSSLNDHILSGSPRDEIAYRAMVARRLELVEIRDEIKAVYSRAINEDDHDD